MDKIVADSKVFINLKKDNKKLIKNAFARISRPNACAQMSHAQMSCTADKRRQEPINYFFAKRTRSQSDQSDVVQSTDSKILSSENQVECYSASEAEEDLTVSTNQQERPDLTFPEIWTVETWEDKKKVYPWLSCESGKLDCTICSSVVKLGAFKTQGVSLSKEWCYIR